MIVLQSAVNEATFEVLYNAMMVNKTQLSVGCVNCRHDVDISELTENARHEIAGHENTRHENTEHEFARHDKISL